MNDPRRPLLPPPSFGPTGSRFGNVMGWIVAWIGWMLVAFIGFVFIVSVLIWLAILIAFSLISGWIRGRPSTVSILWRRYRDLMRGHWPEAPNRKRSATSRADSAAPPGRSDTVEDVSWRDVPGGDDKKR